MRRVMSVLGVLVAIAGLVMGAVAFAGKSKDAPQGSGEISLVHHEVVVRSEDGAERPGRGTVVEGETITTDPSGVGRVDWSDGSVTRIGPSSTMKIEKLRTSEGIRKIAVSLDVGKTWHRVAKATSEGSTYEVRTSNAVAAVRGTSLAVACASPRSCVVGVAEGVVEVTDESGATRSITAGQQVAIEGEHMGETQPFVADDFLQDSVARDVGEGVPVPQQFPATSTTTTAPAPVDRGKTIDVGGTRSGG